MPYRKPLPGKTVKQSKEARYKDRQERVKDIADAERAAQDDKTAKLRELRLAKESAEPTGAQKGKGPHGY